MGSRFITTIDKTGPFFRNDPAKTFRSNARSMLRQMGIEGQVDVVAQLLSGEGGRAPISAGVQPARVSGHVAVGVPYTPGRSKTGNIDVNIYVPNFGMTAKQGKALMAAYSRVERETGAFRRTTTRLRSARAVNVNELVRGIA